MKLFDQLKEYLVATKEEFRKVSWPTRKDTFRYSTLVIAISLLVAAFFAGLDMGFTDLTSILASSRSAAAPSTSAPIQGSTPIQVDTTPVPSNTNSAPVLDLGDIKTQTAPANTNSQPTAPTQK